MEIEKYPRNSVLVRDDGTLYRLLTSDADTGIAQLILLGTSEALPIRTACCSLEKHFKPSGPTSAKPLPAKSEGSAGGMTPLLRTPSPARIASSERAWKAIEQLVENPDIFDRDKRNKLLEKQAKEQPQLGTAKTLLRYLRAFWQGGQTQDALLGSYDKSGRPDVVGTGGRGRKAEDSKGNYQLKETDLVSMRDVLETFYLVKGKRRTVTASLQELHERHYTYADGNNKSCLLPQTECPSYRQLDYFLKQNYPLEERLRRRLGDKEFEQNHRSTEGSIQLDCHGIGHMYEFDATIADVILVSSADAAALVGKPTLYLIIDRASRMIVGWYVGFENASYDPAMHAILSLGQDKEALCRDLGIEYDPADWVAHGILPESFLADQGELTSKKARRIARAIRATLMNVPGLRPDWKPLVECGFAMVHQIIAPHTPAYMPDADNRRRRATKHDKDAALNLKRFTALIVKAIITHNKTMQTGFPLSISQVAEGIPPIPRELYAHGLHRRMGKLDKMDFERVRAELMPRDSATITEDGLRFRKLFYDCPEATKRGWLVEGRRKRKPLEVAYDYRLIDEIIVYSPDGSGESFVAKLTKDSGQFKGMAFADVQRHFDNVAKLIAPASETKRQARYEYNQFSKPIIEESVAEMKAATQGRSRSSRKRDTAEARESELGRERRDGAVGVKPSPQPTSSTSGPTVTADERGAPLSAKVIPMHRAAAVQPTRCEPSQTVEDAASRPLTLKERMALTRKQMEN